MEPVELTLARYRTADLMRDAQTSRVAATTRPDRAVVAPPAAARRVLVAATTATTHLQRSVHAPLLALAHRLGPRPSVDGQVCCA